jgi:hypothetical protein
VVTVPVAIDSGYRFIIEPSSSIMLGRRTSCNAVVLLIAVAGYAGGIRESQPMARAAAADYVGALTASYSRLSRLSWDATVHTNVTRAPDSASYESVEWLSVRRADDRWLVDVRRSGDNWSAGELQPFSQWTFTVFGRQQAFQVEVRGDFTGQRLRLSSDFPPAAKAAKLVVLGSIDGSPPIKDVSPFNYVRGGSFVYGWMDDYCQLPSLLSGRPDRGAPTGRERPDSVMLSTVTQYGACTAFLDAKIGYLPSYVVDHRAGDDMIGTEHINQVAPATPGRIWPASKLRAYDQVIDNVEFRSVGNIPLAGAFTNTKTYSYTGGQSLKFSDRFLLGEVHSTNLDDFRPPVAIADGTPVYVPSSPNIAYVWKGNAIVPDIKPATVSPLETLSEHPGVPRHILLLLANGVVVAVLLLWILWRRRATS